MPDVLVVERLCNGVCFPVVYAKAKQTILSRHEDYYCYQFGLNRLNSIPLSNFILPFFFLHWQERMGIIQFRTLLQRGTIWIKRRSLRTVIGCGAYCSTVPCLYCFHCLLLLWEGGGWLLWTDTVRVGTCCGTLFGTPAGWCQTFFWSQKGRLLWLFLRCAAIDSVDISGKTDIIPYDATSPDTPEDSKHVRTQLILDLFVLCVAGMCNDGRLDQIGITAEVIVPGGCRICWGTASRFGNRYRAWRISLLTTTARRIFTMVGPHLGMGISTLLEGPQWRSVTGLLQRWLTQEAYPSIFTCNGGRTRGDIR